MYQYVSCEWTFSTTGMHCDMFAHNDLKVFACIGLHCVHYCWLWYVLIKVLVLTGIMPKTCTIHTNTYTIHAF